MFFAGSHDVIERPGKQCMAIYALPHTCTSARGAYISLEHRHTAVSTSTPLSVLTRPATFVAVGAGCSGSGRASYAARLVSRRAGQGPAQPATTK